MSRKIPRLAASAALALAAMSATVLPASANEVLDTCYGAYGAPALGLRWMDCDG
ncbi:hypothetical protein [Rhabdothermincola sediminis]|uniref:hypothetical protein n=1 Tax=Rhabdothermincola sediminis TaxID=2751370 RepID=UPI001AA09BF0|nr:hypothetical protein [Rhabdothermincola sediminis]